MSFLLVEQRATKLRESVFQAPATHTTALTDAWEFWDPVTQCRHSPEGLWANAVQREGGMSGSNSVLDQFLKLGLGFFFSGEVLN